MPTADCSAQNLLPTDGCQWVEFFVKEMMSASSVDDARARAARVLEILEKSIKDRAAAEVSENYQKVLFDLVWHNVALILVSSTIVRCQLPTRGNHILCLHAS